MYAGSGPWGTSTIISAAHRGPVVASPHLHLRALSEPPDREEGHERRDHHRHPRLQRVRAPRGRLRAPVRHARSDGTRAHRGRDRRRRVQRRHDGASPDEVYGHLPTGASSSSRSTAERAPPCASGISVAAGARVLATDADLSIRPATSLPRGALDDCDIAAGLAGPRGPPGYNSLVRTVAARTFNWLVRHYTGTRCATPSAAPRGTASGRAGSRPLRLLRPVRLRRRDALPRRVAWGSWCTRSR